MEYPPKLRPKKGWSHQTEDAPLPIPIQSLTGNKPASNSRWFYYTAKLVEGSVLVQKKGDQHFLYRMGFFGKGNLSRGKPEHAHFVSSFQGHQRKSLPATERRFQQKRFQKVRQHRYERHLSWSKLKALKLSKQRQRETENHLKLEDTPSTSKDQSYQDNDEATNHSDAMVTSSHEELVNPEEDNIQEETDNVRLDRDDSSSDLEEISYKTRQTTPVKKEWIVDASQWNLSTAHTYQVPACKTHILEVKKLNESCKEDSNMDYTCRTGLKKDGDWDSQSTSSPIKRNYNDIGLRHETRKKRKTVEQEVIGKESNTLNEDIEAEMMKKEPDTLQEEIETEMMAKEADTLNEDTEAEMIIKEPDTLQEGIEAETMTKQADTLQEEVEAEMMKKEPDTLQEEIEAEMMAEEADTLNEDIEAEMMKKEPDTLQEEIEAEMMAEEADTLNEDTEAEMIIKEPDTLQEEIEAEMMAEEADTMYEDIEADRETKEQCKVVRRAAALIEDRPLDGSLDHSHQQTVEDQDEEKEDDNDIKGNKQKASVIRKPDPYPVQEFLQLSYEETFFLSYGLGCLSLCKPSKTSGEEIPMNLVDIWKEFLLLKPQFVATYACYHYYRSKGWVPRCGIKYGCDFVIYKKGPSFYHSTFAVLAHLVTEGTEMIPALSSWYSFTAFSRVIENAAKDVILCYVTYPDEFTQVQLQSPACIPYLKVHEVCMKRWRPTRERESREYQSLIS